MFGLGKRRTPFGKFIDRHNISQEQLVEMTGLSRDTLTNICNNEDSKPRRSTMTLLIAAVRQLTRVPVKKEDFWT